MTNPGLVGLISDDMESKGACLCRPYGRACQRRGSRTVVKPMASPTPELLNRTVQPRYANGERKLARSAFMQTTWGLLALAAIAQLGLLVWLDIL